MKKILAILVLLCPLIIKAQDIDNYYINATLSKDGNLIVEEYIETKETEGYFERDIYKKPIVRGVRRFFMYLDPSYDDQSFMNNHKIHTTPNIGDL